MNDLFYRLSSASPLKRDAQDAIVELKRLQRRVEQLEAELATAIEVIEFSGVDYDEVIEAMGK